MDILNIILGSIFAVMFLVALVSLAEPLWGPVYWKISRWFKFRNRRLCDYSDLYSVAGLVVPSMDGLIDSDLKFKIERRLWRREVFGERRLLVSQLSAKHANSVKDRYEKPLEHVFRRSARLLLMNPNQRHYFGFDDEFEDQWEAAKAIQPHNCLNCRDSGRTWGNDSSLRWEVTCECKKKAIKVL